MTRAALQFIRVTPRLPDARYFLLHVKRADKTIAPDEQAELDMMIAEKRRAA